MLCPLHGWKVSEPGVGLNDSSWATFTALAVSTDDGSSFQKPLRNLVEWRGSTANNFVIAGPAVTGSHAKTGGQMEGNAVWYDEKAKLYRNQAKVDQWAAEGSGPGKGYGAISTWSSADGIKWTAGGKWQPSPGRVDRQEVVYWDADWGATGPCANSSSCPGSYILGTKSDLLNDISQAPLMTRLFSQPDDPYLRQDSVAAIRAGPEHTVWGLQRDLKSRPTAPQLLGMPWLAKTAPVMGPMSQSSSSFGSMTNLSSAQPGLADFNEKRAAKPKRPMGAPPGGGFRPRPVRPGGAPPPARGAVGSGTRCVRCQRAVPFASRRSFVWPTRWDGSG